MDQAELNLYQGKIFYKGKTKFWASQPPVGQEMRTNCTGNVMAGSGQVNPIFWHYESIQFSWLWDLLDHIYLYKEQQYKKKFLKDKQSALWNFRKFTV